MKSIFIIVTLIYSTIIFGQDADKVSSTGDRDIDNAISDINDRAKKDYDGFKNDMSSQFGLSSGEVDRYVKQDKIEPGDIFYGSVMARSTNRSVSDVMNRYKNTRGWGKLAKDLGIQPGSEQFHNLKKNTLMGPGNKSGNKNNNEVKFDSQKNYNKSKSGQNKTYTTPKESEKNNSQIKSQKPTEQSSNPGKAPKENNSGKK
jgi:hypothetical protein